MLQGLHCQQADLPARVLQPSSRDANAVPAAQGIFLSRQPRIPACFRMCWRQLPLQLQLLQQSEQQQQRRQQQVQVLATLQTWRAAAQAGSCPARV